MSPVRGLVVEDEVDLCHLICRYLRRLGYDVTTARSGEEAWTAISSGCRAFDLYLIDVTLPGLPGDELAERIVRGNPSAKIILSSGYTPDWQEREPGRAFIRYLQKPYQPKQLADMLQAVAGERDSLAPDLP